MVHQTTARTRLCAQINVHLPPRTACVRRAAHRAFARAHRLRRCAARGWRTTANNLFAARDIAALACS